MNNHARKPGQMCSSDDLLDPKLCTKPPVTPLPSKCGTNTDNCSGTNTCALELIIGDGTHMTISYICNCDKKDEIIGTVLSHIKSNWVGSTILDIDLGKMMGGFFSENSRCIVGKLAELKSFVTNFLINNGYCIETGLWGGTPHTEVLWNVDPKCRTPNAKVDILNKNNWKIE